VVDRCRVQLQLGRLRGIAGVIGLLARPGEGQEGAYGPLPEISASLMVSGRCMSASAVSMSTPSRMSSSEKAPVMNRLSSSLLSTYPAAVSSMKRPRAMAACISAGAAASLLEVTSSSDSHLFSLS
jgi:hypothetical protein